MSIIISTFNHPDTNSIHTNCFLKINRLEINASIKAYLQIYADRESYLAGYSPLLKKEFQLTKDDKDSINFEQTKTPDQILYELLTTIDPDESEATYSGFFADLKNDSISSITQAQKNNFTWSEGDRINLEVDSEDATQDKIQVYQSSAWVDE